MDRDFDHVLLRGIGRLADRLADFIRLAEPDADFPLVVARDDEGAEAEAASALHDFGASVDEHDFLRRLLGFAGSVRA